MIENIIVGVVIAMIAALAKAYLDIQTLKDKVQRLNEDRIVHEQHNDEQFKRIYDKLDEIRNILINSKNA